MQYDTLYYFYFSFLVICHPFAYADDLDEYLISNERPGRFPVGYVFTYSCVENYHLVGPSNVTCLINGSLSARHRPQCERDRKNLDQLPQWNAHP